MMKKFSPNIIGNCLGSLLMHHPEGEVVVYGERRVNWAEMTVRARKIAQALIKLGVQKGDKVTFMFHNCPEFIELNYGIQLAGAIPVPMNYRFTPREIEFQANHSDSVVFVYEDLFAENVEKAAGSLSGIKHFVRKGRGALESAIPYEEFVASGNAFDPAIPTDWNEPAVMIYTGGTTGFPKGVLLSYEAHLEMFSRLLANIVVHGLQLELTPEQQERINEGLPLTLLKPLMPILRSGPVKKFVARPRTAQALTKAMRRLLSNPELAKRGYKNTIKYMIPSMPFFHDASYQIIILAAFAGNVCFVLVPGVKFDPEKILATVEKEQPMLMANVPTGWKKLVSHPARNKYDLSSLRIAATGAGAASVELKKKIFETFPNALVADLFGQTEMTPVTTFRIDTSPETLKERSVGKSIVEVKVVDENGNELPPGQVGEIMYRSNTVMMGYYKDEDKTREVMNGGWFRSGDLGYIDEEGEVRLVDRKKECINTGGEKVFPLEVEEILQQHPKVEEVCVIGVPDEEWGNTVRAVVQLKKGETATPEEIIEFCRDKLAGYKIPKSVVFVDELPLSPVGKVLRQKIREMYGKPELAPPITKDKEAEAG